ncbi:murein transglycosylase A [Methylovirgula sp. HY1]|uniref:murein transglycosylase A n=1 Tax=Methylovirgula sp. HY1 TaxID=2822761 RepID=UPI001C5B5B6A|nr:MltA domain-containing protein [Methylovirgula sp. HY1]QXX75497.1 Membrane-bound lytic murein transglycosylase A [Methylovirgula sp. HY1]
MPRNVEAERVSATLSATAAPIPLLLPLRFADLADFADDDHHAAFVVFAQHAAAILGDQAPLRPAREASAELRAICRHALDEQPRTQAAARRFFEENFAPFRVVSDVAGAAQGFVTGYYEPVVAGSLTRSESFTAPILCRPADLVTLPQGTSLPGLAPELSAARRMLDGSYAAYPDRAAIEAGALAELAQPLVWLADPVEVFFVQVQGSARVLLPDGRQLRLTYAGRNGHPYRSIGRILVESGEIPAADMGLERVKGWIRAHGQAPGEAGAALMLRNKSYVFFAATADLPADAGPIGGAGLNLSPFRSIAVDRSIWSYGLPFWLDGALPWQSAALTPFRRLMIAADTGAAIIGPARADIYFGSGAEAGTRAGSIRHGCDFIVLLPRERRCGGEA